MLLFHPAQHLPSHPATWGTHRTPTTVLHFFVCQESSFPLSGAWSKPHKCLQNAIHSLANTEGLGKLCPNSFTTQRGQRGGVELHHAARSTEMLNRTVLMHPVFAMAPPELAAMTLPFLFPPCFDLLSSPTPTAAWGSLWSAAKEGFRILKQGGKASCILSCPCEKTTTMIQFVTGKYNLCWILRMSNSYPLNKAISIMPFPSYLPLFKANGRVRIHKESPLVVKSKIISINNLSEVPCPDCCFPYRITFDVPCILESWPRLKGPLKVLSNPNDSMIPWFYVKAHQVLCHSSKLIAQSKTRTAKV